MISTTFSVVSITFAIVIAETVGLQHKFCILFNCNYFMFCLQMIMPRIWPLNKIPDEFTKEVSENTRLEKLPEGKTALGYGFEEATIVGLKAPGFKEFWKSGLKL